MYAGNHKDGSIMKSRILLTGVTGFIGEHLATYFLQKGYEVHAIVRPSSKLENISIFLQQGLHIHVHDTQNDLIAIIESAKPDIVIHLASCFLARHTYEDIDEMLESNVIFGTKLLEAMVQNNVYRFINTGTAWQHYENRRYSPANLYAASKQAFEVLMQYYQETTPLKTITLELFDTYGPGDKRKKLLALFAEIAESGETLAMSPGGQKIDLVHVDDVVSAFALASEYLLTEQYQYCGTYVVSSGHAITLRDLAKRYERLSGKKLSIAWGGRLYREREVMDPWHEGIILPGWKREHSDLM